MFAHLTCIPALLLLSLAVLTHGADAAAPPSIAGLAKGETFEVTFASSGCFHQSSDSFTITSHAIGLTGKGRKAKRPRLALKPSEIKKLDALLKFYAAGPANGCTTVDSITLKHVKAGKILQTYQYTDASCSTHRKKNVLTFHAIMQRMEIAAPF